VDCERKSYGVSLVILQVQPKAPDLVSVVIPTYNRAGLVGTAIQSALAQSHSPVEVLVVDDGSTDDTIAALSRFSGVHVFRQENRGQGAARQLGLEHASGAYIASLDSDDQWKPEFLEESLRALRQTGAGFVFSNWSTLKAGGDLATEDALSGLDYLAEEPYRDAGGWHLLSPKSTRRVFTRHCPAPSSSFLVDRRYISHGWSPEFRIADDWAFLLDIALRHEVGCDYTTRKLWNKGIDGTNICDRHRDAGALAVKEIADLEQVLRSFGALLTWRERKHIRGRIARGFGDLAYCQSIVSGTRRLALVSALRSLRAAQSVLGWKILAKCLIRSAAGARS
jgi:glycosyltransferase involved in cell wall biosynthesis